MNKAVFFDRDGVINKEVGDYVWQLENFIINDGVAEFMMDLQQRNFLIIVITNQGGIAKGLYSKEEVEYLHLHLERVLKNKGITIDEIYYCPHHPEEGNCLCRKPGSQLTEKAIARFNIDPSRSYFIGDRQRDIDSGEAAGVKGILVESNQPLKTISHLIQ